MSSDDEEYDGSEGSEDDDYDALIDDDFEFDDSAKFKLSIEEYKAEFFAKDELNTISDLTENQLAAIRYIVSKSREESEKAKPVILQRILGLGYADSVLDQVATYVKDQAPLIIHLNLDLVLTPMINDTQYRNLFETGRSGGTNCTTSRTQWENRMFNNIYDKATPNERVKYGVLNVVSDPYGIAVCAQYGDSYLLLKNVRLRTSFASGDTSADVKIASCEYYFHVLTQYSDAELKEVIDISLGLKPYADNKVISIYKEVQYHGNIRLDRDVEALVVAKRHTRSDPIAQNIELFSQKHNIPLIWLCDLS